MRRDPGLSLGALLHERLVGSVVASFDGRKGWINRLAVVPGERRRGIARRLIAEAEGLLRGRGALVIAALVEEDNNVSLALFKACGYELERHVLYLTKRDPGDV
jgi:ribosomal protein S18 acetylase RimI-like enzyme